MKYGRRATPEGAIKSAIKQYLRFKGWFVVHIQGGPLSHPGISDLIAVKSDTVVFVEIKTERTNQHDAQKTFQEDLEAKGGKYFVLRSLEDAQKMERSLGMFSK